MSIITIVIVIIINYSPFNFPFNNLLLFQYDYLIFFFYTIVTIIIIVTFAGSTRPLSKLLSQDVRAQPVQRRRAARGARSLTPP